MSGELTDGGQGGWIEAKTIITTVRTRFNMCYLAVLTDMEKEPAQESIVANRRTIAHKCDMPPCPSNGYIHAPVVTKEPYRSQGVRPNLTGLTNKHHFSLRYRSSSSDKKKGVLLLQWCNMIYAVQEQTLSPSQIRTKAKPEHLFTIDMTTASASLPWKLSMVDTSTPEASGYSSSLSLNSCTCAM